MSRASGAAVAALTASTLLVTTAIGSGVWDHTPSGPETGRIVISELMVDPAAVADSRGEFIELHNPTSVTVGLAGWTIGDEQYDRYEIEHLTIQPGDYGVLARHGDIARNGGVAADEVYGDALVLRDAGDRLILRDQNGELVDIVDYSTGAWPVVPGRSMSLVDPAADNNDPSNWCLSTTTMRRGDLGSPGRANTCSASAAQLVFSEVMVNPRYTSNSVGEWFELTNIGTSAVDLDRFTFQDESGESFTIERSVVVEAGRRVVFGVTDDEDLNGGVTVDYAYGDAMRLLNAYDELIVNDASGVLVDRIRWDDGRTFPSAHGASIVLSDVTLDSSDGANWCLAATRWADGDYGTPGTAGGCEHVDVAQVVITEIMSDPQQSATKREGEWFELVNTGDQPAVLAGYRLRTFYSEHVIGQLTVEPGAVVVLGAEADPARNGGIEPDYVFGSELRLHRIGGRLEILSPEGRLVDRVRWSAGRGFTGEAGHSIELRSPEIDNALGANWCRAQTRYGDAEDGDFGTPGQLGSCPDPAPVVPLGINEVMRRPFAVDGPRGQWIEVHNPSEQAVDLFNWTLTDDASDYFLIRSSVVVPAGGFAVVARHADPTLNGGVEADIVTGPGMTLRNDHDSVILTDQFGRFVDRVAWTDSDEMPRPRGASISLMPNGTWCVTATQFGAGDAGTPGAPNDCAPIQRGNVIVNEIHRQPRAVVDSRGEWIELYNRGTAPVDISGWTIRDDGFNTFVFDPNTPLVIEPGAFLVAARNGPEVNGGVPVDVLYGAEIHLLNAADEVVLQDRNLKVVDRVAWTPTNGFPLVPGASMALRDPDLDGAVGANWCASVTDQGNGDLGTPGAPNLCQLPADDDPAPTMTQSVFAVGAASCPGSFTVDGMNITMAGDVRSNGSVAVSGSSIQIAGSVSYGTTQNIGWGANVGGEVINDPAFAEPGLSWSLDDFQPGAMWAEQFSDHLHVHPNGLTIQGNAASLAPGIHVVDGNVTISTNQIRLDDVSIVATGTIAFTATNVWLDPFDPVLPVLFAAGGDCNQTTMAINANVIDITGTVSAPNGRVELQGNNVTTEHGAVIGASINIGANRVKLGHPAT